MNIIIFVVYMILGLFAARQLQIGLVKNARESGANSAPLRSRKFHRLLIVLIFLFTGLPYLAVRFVPGSQMFAVFVYSFGLAAQTSILAISPSQPELGWAMLAYTAASSMALSAAASKSSSSSSSSSAFFRRKCEIPTIRRQAPAAAKIELKSSNLVDRYAW